MKPSNAYVREARIENYFVKRCEAAGALVEKLTFARRGGADRLVAFKGKLYLVELKAPKGVLSALQKVVKSRFASRGVPVFVCHTRQQVDGFVETYLAV